METIFQKMLLNKDNWARKIQIKLFPKGMTLSIQNYHLVYPLFLDNRFLQFIIPAVFIPLVMLMKNVNITSKFLKRYCPQLEVVSFYYLSLFDN